MKPYIKISQLKENIIKKLLEMFSILKLKYLGRSNLLQYKKIAYFTLLKLLQDPSLKWRVHQQQKMKQIRYYQLGFLVAFNKAA